MKRHYKVFYTNLPISGKLRSYLANIDEQAKTIFSTGRANDLGTKDE